MAAGAVSLKNLTKREEVRKLEKELIRPIVRKGPDQGNYVTQFFKSLNLKTTFPKLAMGLSSV